MRSYGETRCIDQMRPKTQMKMKDTKKHRAIHCMNCRTGCRSSEKIWSMTVALTPKDRDSARSSHELPLESRANVETGSGKHSVYTHFPKDPFCLKTKITSRRRAGTDVLRADKFGDLITADHKILSEGIESRDTHRYAVVVQDWATKRLQSYPCKTKTYQETQKSPMKFLEQDLTYQLQGHCQESRVIAHHLLQARLRRLQ